MVSPVVACRVLRGFAACCFGIAFAVMLACTQNAEVYSIEFVAKASDWPGFWFFVVVNLIAFAYNVAVCCIPEGYDWLWKRVVFLDLMFSTLMSALLGVEWQTYSLFVKGNANAFYANWLPICGGNGILPIFCRNFLVSLISSTVGSAICFGFLISCVGILINCAL